MDNNVSYQDSEFSLSGNDKVDFKSILYKQIDYIRFLRTKDMGEFIVFGLDSAPVDPKLEREWFANISIFQNAVQSLQRLLRTYHDEEYETNINKISINYEKELDTKQRELIKAYTNPKNGIISIHVRSELKRESAKLRMLYVFKNGVKRYDDFFEECLLLMERAKFIGGNELIAEND